MPLRRPSKADLAAISSRRHLRLTEVELEDLYELVCANLNLYDELEHIAPIASPASRGKAFLMMPESMPVSLAACAATLRLTSLLPNM